MTDLTFDSRDTWLSYRADWKARYKAASETIRRTKREIREGHAAARLAESDRKRDRIGWRVSSLQGDLHGQRRRASDMMEELGEAKERKAELLAARDAIAA